MRKLIPLSNTILVVFVVIFCTIQWPFYSLLGIAIFFLGIGIYDLIQTKHTILRNFPIIGHSRYLLEAISPEIHQYFIESDTDGKPIDRNHRTYIYKRSKGAIDTHPFGTELDMETIGYSWMKHSIYPSPKLPKEPRVDIGGPDCKKPYSASIFNISAMSFGSLSKPAIEALNKGAKAGEFFHNTGEGGISEHHLHGGDLVYQIGTGYFGCRDDEGNFSEEEFKKQAARDEVKMIEIKLSQGAKPGHGGVLPAKKNSKEIARVRGVEPHTKIESPPAHTAFTTDKELVDFIAKLRELSEGKPIGIKLCIGSHREFKSLCKTMAEEEITPDFITIDGAEGGTGAAPIDFSNYVGMPWESALIFAIDCLNGYGIRDRIKVITSAKIFTAFDIFRALCLGANLCNSGRGMMLALGCIQALKCDSNNCPTGVTSNKPKYTRGLVVKEKWRRVCNYHETVVDEFLELFSAAGCEKLEDVDRNLIQKNHFGANKMISELHPHVVKGSYLN